MFHMCFQGLCRTPRLKTTAQARSPSPATAGSVGGPSAIYHGFCNPLLFLLFFLPPHPLRRHRDPRSHGKESPSILLLSAFSVHLHTHKEEKGWGQDIPDLSTVYIVIRSSWYFCILSLEGLPEAEKSQQSTVSLPGTLQNQLVQAGWHWNACLPTPLRLTFPVWPSTLALL